MKTEHRLAEALKNMMSERSLDDISVLALTKKCKVNRQTFYYYFHDIYDLLSLVFLDEKIKGIEDCKNYLAILTKIYDYYSKNNRFVDATLNSAGKDLFQEFIYNIFYQASIRFVTNVEDSKKLTPNGRKTIARFYASAYSNSTIYYLANYKNKSLNGLLNCFAFMEDKQIAKSVQNMVKNIAKTA